MIAVTDDFVEKVELANKRPKVKVEIDWDMDANYENETSYAMSVGVE